MQIGYQKIGHETGHTAGRALLEQMYRQQTGEDMPQICTTQRGKPYFVQGKWHFSISHTKNHVFCALADRPVGIDAEELTRQVKPMLARKILSAGEFAQYEQAPEQNRALLTFWVLKEAQAKCTGEGINGYACHTDFSLDDPRVTEMEGCLVAVIEGEAECYLIPMPI